MPESIATSILPDRLKRWVVERFIIKTKSKTNKLVYHYLPTQKAFYLISAIMMIRQCSENIYLNKMKILHKLRSGKIF